jgi:pyruvate formate lyase activating enzyme
VKLREARYYEKLEAGRVRCFLCPQVCAIAPGESGKCFVRKNIDGSLFAMTYAKVSAVAMDPIEKKPLYHFYPGSGILSVGSVGCNFTCPFCQNYHLVERKTALDDMPPEKLVKLALEHESIGIAYTYNEPMIWFEYVMDCAKLARKEGLKNVLVTNGYISPEPLKEMLPLIDAMNIDLKYIRDGDYAKYSGARVGPVKKTIEEANKACMVELTNLIVTGVNDSDEDIEGLIDWVAFVDRSIPLHFSRYFPQYKFDNPATPQSSLKLAYELATRKLDYVYVGNISMDEGNDTLCPKCRNLLISRSGYNSKVIGLKGRNCSNCGNRIRIVI